MTALKEKRRDIPANKNSRDIAVNSLLAFESKSRQIQPTLEAIFQSHEVEPRERHLASELAYGSCRQLITLDHLIKHYSSRSIRHIDPVVRQILRVGLYQMIYLSGAPDFAILNEAVDQAKGCGLTGADKFVNAILRAVQRDIKGPIIRSEKVPQRAILWLDEQKGCEFKRDIWPDPTKNTVKYYSCAYAHPSWLVEHWLKRYDEQTVRKICLANNARVRLTLRANQRFIRAEELAKRLNEAGIRAAAAGPGVRLLQGAVPEQLPGYGEGWFAIQDATAMKASMMLGPRPGQRVLDMCAAPGGKTTHLAELMDDTGAITACDISKEKLSQVEANCQRLGISMVQTCLPQELEEIIVQEGPFDAVMVDVPCSNTGVMGRRAEVRHRLKPVHLHRLTSWQKELLNQAARMVKKGGKILYSTCSIEPVENELLVEGFLRENRHFGREAEETYLPAAKYVPTQHKPAEDTEGKNRAYQHWYDGGYMALLRGGGDD